MAKRLGNALLTRLVRGGRGPKAIRLVTIRGRTTGRTTLSRGPSREEVRLIEVPIAERVPLLRAYLDLNKSRMARTYFGATPYSSDAELAGIAPEHAVFRLEPA